IERLGIGNGKRGELRVQNGRFEAGGGGVKISEVSNDSASGLHGKAGYLTGDGAIEVSDNDEIVSGLIGFGADQGEMTIGGASDGRIVKEPLEGQRWRPEGRNREACGKTFQDGGVSGLRTNSRGDKRHSLAGPAAGEEKRIGHE